MKAVTLIVFVALIVAVSCRPDLKKVKEEGARKKACLKDCSKAPFEPICAGKVGDTTKSFGSECVMNNYNCEHKDTLAKLGDGECPGSDGIRLS